MVYVASVSNAVPLWVVYYSPLGRKQVTTKEELHSSLSLYRDTTFVLVGVCDSCVALSWVLSATRSGL